MPTVTPTAARDQVAPALQKAQDTLTDTVLPAVRDALAIAIEKGAAVLDSDTTHEAKRRGAAVFKAAKGQPVIAPPARRWRFGLGMLAIGTGIGFGFTYLKNRLAAPVDSYQFTPSTPVVPVPSGTDGGTTTDSFPSFDSTASNGTAATAGTATENIDLRTGAPSNL